MFRMMEASVSVMGNRGRRLWGLRLWAGRSKPCETFDPLTEYSRDF
jgi:hypothetical protein